VLDGVALGLPALLRAVKLQKRAARVGFDWPSTDEVIDKIVEEAAELRAESDPARQFEEMGDLLFVMANLARHLGIDPEAALRAANAKFVRRFGAIEAALAAQGQAAGGVGSGGDGRALGCGEGGGARRRGRARGGDRACEGAVCPLALPRGYFRKGR
jgi:phosphoribosyl-ATP pyrophosphohydrolase